MAFVKRIFLFVCMNLLVILTVSFILNFFHVQPYLSAYGLDFSNLLTFCMIWGMTGAFISLALSRVMAKWMLGVRTIDFDSKDPQMQQLLYTVSRLSQRAGIDMPQVGIYQSQDVNAFATGPTKKRSLVAVSTGLLNRMNEKELEGVLGHEIAHISNGDMVTMTLLQGVINAFVMFLARALASILSGFGRDKNSRSSSGNHMSYMLLTFLFESVFMALGFLVIAAFSRWREFRADQGGAEVAGKDAMIAALRNLQTAHTQHESKQHEAVAAFKISQTQRKGIRALFSTHPPLEERIRRLEIEVYA